MRTSILSIIVLSLLILSASAAENRSADRNPVRDKARYYYIEGLIRQTEGNDDEAHEYFKKAYSIDTTYSEAASDFGMSRMLIDIDTLQSRKELKRSLSMMKKFIEFYPEEYYKAQYYAYVAAKVDSPKEAIRVLERTATLHPEKTGVLLSLSDFHLADGNPDKALEAISRYEKAEGMSPQLSVKKAQVFLSRQDTVGALNEISRLQLSQPKNPAFLLLKGNFFLAMQKPDSALACFLRAEELDPEDGAAKLSLANYYLENGDSVKYDRKVYEALLAEDFGLQEKTEILANYLQTLINDKSDKSRGDHLFDVLNSQYPHEPSLIDLSARYSASKRDFKNAVEQISYAIDLNPNNETFWGQLMSYQIADDRFKDAEDTYNRAAKHFTPVPRDLKILYATSAQLGKDYDKAVNVYADIIRDKLPGIQPSDTLRESMMKNLTYDDLSELSGLFTSIGDVYMLEEKYPQAYLAYDNALTLLPDNPMTLNNYAYFMAVNDGDLDRALDMSARAIAKESENDTFLDTYAWVLFKKGDYKEALKYQENALKIAEADGSTPSSDLYEHYGDILFMNKQPEKALEYWKKALELDPENELLKKKVSHKTYFYK